MNEKDREKENVLSKITKNKKLVVGLIIFFVLFFSYIYFTLSYVCSSVRISVDESFVDGFICTKRKLIFRKDGLIYGVTITKEFLEKVCK